MAPSLSLSTSSMIAVVSSLLWPMLLSTSSSSAFSILPSMFLSNSRNACQAMSFRPAIFRSIVAAMNSLYSMEPLLSESMLSRRACRSAGISSSFFRHASMPFFSSVMERMPSSFLSILVNISRSALMFSSSSRLAMTFIATFLSLFCDRKPRRFSTKPASSDTSVAFGAFCVIHVVSSASDAVARLDVSIFSSDFIRSLASLEIFPHSALVN
mmetsp:Transcript_88906/g.252076  ORF Transcript_88906/g.252076 Transcript_88906/m.252076 type:complete len:213 (+) Transcript_88906:275-913(+)